MFSFDLYGNLYLHQDNLIYQLYFNRDNIPVFEQGDYPVIDLSTVDIEEIKHDKLHRDAIEQSETVYEQEEETEEEINEDYVRLYGEHNKPFKFSGKEFEIANRDIVCALYDTYVYSHDILVFQSESSDQSSIYGVELHETQLIVKVIGGKTATYNISSLLK